MSASKDKPQRMKVQMNEFDDRTSTDLKLQNFSGIRSNEIMQRLEIWITGDVRKTITYGEFWEDPYSLEMAYCEVFGLKEVTMAGAVQEAMKEMEGRKQGLEELERTKPWLLDKTK